MAEVHGSINSASEHRVVRPAPENFRGSEPGYYPDRLVEETSRMIRLRSIITDAVGAITDVDKKEQAAKRLFDLVVYNAYGNVFPPVNSAADAFGLPDEEVYGKQFENCVVLVKRKKDHCLAPAGGFADMGEGLGQTGMREAKEEIGATLTSPAVIAELSRPERDDRFTVVSMVIAGNINPNELKASDDVEQVVVIRLIDDKGNLIQNFMQPGIEHADVRGEKFTHEGMFAEHDKTLEMFYGYWKKYGKPQGLTLSQTIQKVSKLYPQEWFKGYTPHKEGSEDYPSIPGTPLKETPNIKFAIKTATRIFSEAGVKEADVTALRFVAEAVETGVLPVYEQPAVTADVLALTPDNQSLWVIKMPDGTLRLPGSFYSPEHTDVGRNIQDFAVETVYDKLGTTLKPEVYLGAVGGMRASGEYADSRYPRVSHVFTGILEGEPHLNQDLYPEGEVVAIPVYGPDGQLSTEMRESTWAFNHGAEIVAPLIRSAIALRS